MHLAIPHKTSRQAAVDKIKSALSEHRAEITQHATVNKEEWSGDTLNFEVDLQGKSISGTLEVTDTQYILDAKLPLLWRMFEGRIESEIEKQVKEIS
ncbi:MAG TPA: polyhydroxyalkanoic acid system family protein [Candidatus Paceibacterota bacterium]|nr:polyhydroxyalkanoic acid system family protein [Candidatus Paceibacterota bacterium]